VLALAKGTLPGEPAQAATPAPVEATAETAAAV
jgi:hypothetical protein